MIKKVNFVQGKVIVSILFLILLFTSNIFAGVTGNIVGNVFDQSTGKPLLGANVIIDGSNMGASTGVYGNQPQPNTPWAIQYWTDGQWEILRAS